MIAATSLLDRLQASGACFTIILPDRLRIEAPRGLITLALRSTLAQHKAQLLYALAERQRQAAIEAMLHEVHSDPELWSQLEFEIEERAGILEFDANLPREVAERQARALTLESWLDVIDATDTRVA